MLCYHRRPRLTIRGIDQKIMIYVRVSSECLECTVLCYTLGLGAPYRGFPAFLSPSNCLKTAKVRRLSARYCMEFFFKKKVTKDKIAQWNKMLLFWIKLTTWIHLAWFLFSIWPISCFILFFLLVFFCFVLFFVFCLVNKSLIFDRFLES